jgi:hypothetical protein
VHDKRGFNKCELPRNHTQVTQTSSFLVQSWRANCDIQFLMYKTDPTNIHTDDVARVVNYVVAYACKGNETEIEEKKNIASIILATKEESGDKKDVKRLARRIMNEATKCRMISKQEALCHLARLRLFDCSEDTQVVSISGSVKLGTSSQASKTPLSIYASRTTHFDMSLDQFFYLLNKNCSRTVIPNYTGGRIEAPYPVTPSYARSVLLIYKPWHGKFPYEQSSDTKPLMAAFDKFINDKNNCPPCVCLDYSRAREAYMSKKKELTSENQELDDGIEDTNVDDELAQCIELVKTKYITQVESLDSEFLFDYGNNYDWSTIKIKVST